MLVSENIYFIKKKKLAHIFLIFFFEALKLQLVRSGASGFIFRCLAKKLSTCKHC